MYSLLIQSTPHTVGYMVLGYAIIGGIGLLYVASLLFRQRNLRHDIEVIERLYDDEF